MSGFSKVIGFIKDIGGGALASLATGDPSHVVKKVLSKIGLDLDFVSDDRELTEKEADIVIEKIKAVKDYQSKILTYNKQLIELNFQDVSDARNANIKLATTKDVSFLNANIGPILAIILAILSGSIIFYVLTGNSKVADSVTLLVLNGILTILGTIMGFYFGGSVKESEMNRKLSENNIKL